MVRTIDAHAAGEPLRVIVDGVPPIPGKTMLAKRRYARENLDALRTALLWEPRGHADMYGCLLTEPVSPDSQMGVLFLHNEGFSTMCGHGIIALVTVLLETGLVEGVRKSGERGEGAGGRRLVRGRRGGPDSHQRGEGEPVVLRLDTPAGQVEARAEVEGGGAEVRVRSVSFVNVPSFVYAMDREVEVEGVGRVPYDVAFGGAFYAFVRAEELGLRLVPEEFRRIIELGSRIKRAVEAALPIRHPLEPDLGFLYGTIFVGQPVDSRHHSRNVCVFADGEVDRSPTGTGISARAALHYARGELSIGDAFEVESILGTCFRGRVVDITWVGPCEAVIPEVTGSAHLTGRHEFLLSPDDPLSRGFLLR